jgi:hypothetical protein
MKKLINTYSFDPAAKQITFADAFDLSQLLLITNVTDNVILYNFANPSAGGVLSDCVLTLTVDTTSMSSSDQLQIFYDDKTDAASENALSDLCLKMGLLLDRLDFGLVTDIRKQLKVTLVDSGTLPAISTLTTCSTVTTVANQTNLGAVAGWRFWEAQLDGAYNMGIQRNISY